MRDSPSTYGMGGGGEVGWGWGHYCGVHLLFALFSQMCDLLRSHPLTIWQAWLPIHVVVFAF